MAAVHPSLEGVMAALERLRKERAYGRLVIKIAAGEPVGEAEISRTTKVSELLHKANSGEPV